MTRMRMVGVIVVLAIITLSWAVVEGGPAKTTAAQQKHERWMKKHGRVYEHDEEKGKRFQIFKDNLKFINEFNRRPNMTYKLAPNSFADLTNQEFQQSQLTGTHFRPPANGTLAETDDYGDEDESCDAPAPADVDWRRQGAVNRIRNQGDCSVCWAFATLSAVESMTYIKTGNLPFLSVQQLVDCVYENQGRAGCYTGFGEDAYNYIINNGGVVAESRYPYNPNSYFSRPCQSFHSSNTRPAATIRGFASVRPNDEAALEVAVAAQPVVIQLSSGSREFQFYSGGLFTGECGAQVNHMATMVGYGTSQGGQDYWLLRNQWGRDWGEDGYVRLVRNAGIPGGHCQILSGPTYPY